VARVGKRTAAYGVLARMPEWEKKLA